MGFFWCNIRHINPVKIHPARITQKDKEFVNDPVLENALVKLKRKTTFATMFFVMKTS